MGRLSGIGWAVGYLGGLASLAVALPLVSAHETRWVPITTAGFFLVAGLPTFFFLRERAQPKPLSGPAATFAAIAELRRTFAQRKSLPDLFRFLLALFLEQAGVAIVIMFAALYAMNALGLDGGQTIALFIGLQVAAALGAALFGFVQDRIGGKRALIATILIWLVAVCVTLLADSLPAFCLGAAMAGLAMGSSQASGRAMVGSFTPPNRQGEWFGLWGIAMKAAGVLGIVAYAIVRAAGFSMRAGMWSTAVFFVLSLIVLATVDEERGKRTAVGAH
jgi:UMF1 family MFS transporter